MATSGFDQGAQAAQAPVPAPLDTIRRRARQRLIGAALLVAAAVIAFPLIFDAEPRPIAVDIPIEIPARETAAPLPVPTTPATPDMADAAAIPPPPGPANPDAPGNLPASPPPAQTADAAAQTQPPAQQAVQPAPGQQAHAPQTRPPATPPASSGGTSPHTAAAAAAAAAPPAPARPNTAPANKTPPRPAAPPSSGVDIARALLEPGKGTQVASLAPKPPPARERFVVQVGSFSDASRARAVRAQLEMAGLKTFIQEVKGSDGKTITRVRLGTFTSRGEADRTAARIQALGLDASVVKL